MNEFEIEKLIDWYYEKGGSHMVRLIEWTCALCAQRGKTIYLCTECGACPRHDGHETWCTKK